MYVESKITIFSNTYNYLGKSVISEHILLFIKKIKFHTIYRVVYNMYTNIYSKRYRFTYDISYYPLYI